MSEPLHILHLEDNNFDADLFRFKIEEVWPDCRITRVDNREAFIAALDRVEFDLVLSDFTLPNFDGLSALALLRERGSVTPFLFLSGTIGEDKAVQALHGGALDYVLKDRPARLIPAIRAALDQRQEQQLRRRVEQRLREQAELLDKARDAICVTDIAGHVTYANRSAQELFGWVEQDGTGHRLHEMFGPLNLPIIQGAVHEVLTEGSWIRELQIPGRTEALRHVVSRWTLVRDEAGQPKSILLFNADVTEQKHLEAKLLQSQRLEAIGTLAGGIAHDLNNVLSPILMSVNLLQLKLEDEELLRLLAIVEKSALHGSSLVRQVLAFARGSEGERMEIKPHLVINDVITLLSDTLPRSITIEKDLPPHLWHVIANSTQLGQVLMNLSINARDAMPEGGRLHFSACNVTIDDTEAHAHPGAHAGPHVQLTVSDTGTGIPPSVINRIFDPFFTTKVAGKGTGLGLSTVLGIIKGHGGFLRVRSELGKGTQFELFFPACVQSADPVGEAPAALPVKGQGETILLIDDESSVRDIARAILEAYGYKVILASTGSDGLALYQNHRTEVRAVITDMMMPTMQGSEVITRLREIEPTIGIVAMSGVVGQLMRIKEEPGRTKFLAKPMTAPELISAVQFVLKARPA